MVRVIYLILATLMSLAFMSAMLITFGITMTRYLIGFSDPTAEYLSRYLVIAGAFLGFPVATLSGINIRFDLLDFMAPPRIASLIVRIGAVLAMLCCAVFTYAGWLFVADSMLFGEIMPTGFPMPLWIAHSTVMIGMALATFAFLVVAIRGPLHDHAGVVEGSGAARLD
ncbi:MAG: TRAP transporter small permease [Geminicoccaceae bacterium]|nr:MAG: TRAP transporter small permease [Geminicoccaceae bacterium]